MSVCLSVCMHACMYVCMSYYLHNILTVTTTSHVNRLGYVFWTDYAMKKIQRAYLNGTGPITTVIDRGLEQPTGN